VQCKSVMSAVCCDSGQQCKGMASRRDIQTTGLVERHRNPSQIHGWNWNLNLQITCYLWFRSVAITVPIIVLNGISSA